MMRWITSLVLLLIVSCQVGGKLGDVEKLKKLQDTRLSKKAFETSKNLHMNWYIHAIKAIIGQLGKKVYENLGKGDRKRYLRCLHVIENERDLAAGARCTIEARQRLMDSRRNYARWAASNQITDNIGSNPEKLKLADGASAFLVAVSDTAKESRAESPQDSDNLNNANDDSPKKADEEYTAETARRNYWRDLEEELKESHPDSKQHSGEASQRSSHSDSRVPSPDASTNPEAHSEAASDSEVVPSESESDSSLQRLSSEGATRPTTDSRLEGSGNHQQTASETDRYSMDRRKLNRNSGSRAMNPFEIIMNQMRKYSESKGENAECGGGVDERNGVGGTGYERSEQERMEDRLLNMVATGRLNRRKRSPHRLVTSEVTTSDNQPIQVKRRRKLSKLQDSHTRHTPIQRVTRLVRTIMSGEEPNNNWTLSYNKLVKLRKQMDAKRKLPGAKVYDLRLYDLVLGRDKPSRSPNTNTTDFLTLAYDIIDAFGGNSSKDGKSRNIKILSPRIAPILPDKFESGKKAPHLLSPNIMPLYSDDSPDTIAPLPKMLEASGMAEKDREAVLEMVMDVSGAKTAVDTGLDLLKEMNVFGFEEEIFEATERLTNLFKSLEKSFSNKQKVDMKRRGFSFLEGKQMEKLFDGHGVKDPKDVGFDLKNYEKLNHKQREEGLWAQIERLASKKTAEEHDRQKRFTAFGILEPVVLAPFMFTPVTGISILGPTVLSPSIFSVLLLNPSLLGPYVMSPAVVLPFIMSPYMLSPYVLSPIFTAPFVLSPYFLSPNVLNPYIFSPLILSPYLLCPDVISPQAFGGPILSPSAFSPSIFTESVFMASVLSPTFMS